MPTSSLIAVGVIVPVAGLSGALIWPRIATAIGASNQTMLVSLCCGALLVPIYACAGLLPFVNTLTQPIEIYILAAYFGSVYGSFQAYARAAFSELIPTGQEARFFGLYAITDKSSSFLGPLLVGVCTQATGDLRAGFVVILVALLLPIPIIAFKLDMQRGRQDAEAYAQAVQ